MSKSDVKAIVDEISRVYSMIDRTRSVAEKQLNMYDSRLEQLQLSLFKTSTAEYQEDSP